MEESTNIFNNSDLFIAFVLIIIITFLPVLLFRFLFYRRPVPHKVAIPIAVFIYFLTSIISLVGNNLSGTSQGPSFYIVIIIFMGYSVMRLKRKTTREKDKIKVTDSDYVDVIHAETTHSEEKHHIPLKTKATSGWLSKNWYRLSLMLLIFGTIAFSFYWYNIRPSNIMKACSYVTKTKPAIEYRPALSMEEMESKGMIKKCVLQTPKNTSGGNLTWHLNSIRAQDGYDSCLNDNKKTIAFYGTEQPAVPEQYYQEQASDEEYNFCLQQSGL